LWEHSLASIFNQYAANNYEISSKSNEIGGLLKFFYEKIKIKEMASRRTA
jgi:hypothetical protein